LKYFKCDAFDSSEMKTLPAVLLTAGLLLPCRNICSRTVIFIQPANQTVPAGASVSLSVCRVRCGFAEGKVRPDAIVAAR
jgi:hypothetical protein